MTYGPADLAADLGLPPAAVDRLKVHFGLLTAWSPKINLIGPSELQHYWRRHALDCAQLVAHAPGARTWLDLGSGAGFPGLVIAAVLAGEEGERPCRVDLVEQNAKKAAFLREAAREMQVSARVLPVKHQSLDPQERYDVLTARALAPLSRLIPHAKPWLDRGALGIFPKGADYGSELQAAGFSLGGERQWGWENLEADVLESLSDPDARIVRIRAVESEA